MAKWTTRSISQSPRNGTNVSSFTFTTPAAGSLLIAVVQGAVTFTTPAGWTLVSSAIGNGGLYVWRKEAVGNETGFSSTNNGSNYATAAAVYEFPPGSAVIGTTPSRVGAGTSNWTGASISGLTSTPKLLMAIGGIAVSSGVVVPAWSAWSSSAVEDVDSGVPMGGSPGTDGQSLGIAYLEDSLLTSWTPTATVTDSGLNAEAITLAVQVAEVVVEPPSTGSATGTFSWAGTAVGMAPPVPGGDGPLTDETYLDHTGAGYSAQYHRYAAGLDWSKPVGLFVYIDGTGEFGLNNPSSTYLLAGPNGMIAVAKSHNLLLVTPFSPDRVEQSWHYNDPLGYTDYLETLLRFIYEQYPTLDRARFVAGGYSSGAQVNSRYLTPQILTSRLPAIATDGVVVMISFGGAPHPAMGSTVPEVKENVHFHWDVGDQDAAGGYDGNFGALVGEAWYRSNGFDTSITVRPGLGHSRSDFGLVMDAAISEWVPEGDGGPGPPPSGYETIGTPRIGPIAVGGTSTTTTVVTYPDSVTEGDFLLMAIPARAEVSHVFTAAGWSALVAQSGSFTKQTILYKTAGPSEPSTVTVTGPAVLRSIKMLAVSGVDPDTPFDGVSMWEDTTAAAPEMPSLTPTVPGTMPVWAVTGFLGATVSWTPIGGTNPVEWLDTSAENTAGRSGAAYYESPLAGTDPTGTRGGTPSTAATGAGVFVLLRPAPTPGPTFLVLLPDGTELPATVEGVLMPDGTITPADVDLLLP